MFELRPYQLTILTTNKCTAACDHCSMNSSPKRDGGLTAESMIQAIAEAHACGPLATVIFAGGEPTLLREKLYDAIAFADSLGINTRIVTNASWAVNDHKTRNKIEDLRCAGLRELNISADDYHLPFIPFENVVRAWRAAKGQGFSSVVIANSYGPTSIVSPDYIFDQLGETLDMRFDEEGSGCDLPPPQEDGTVYMVSNARTQMLGRAHSKIDRSEILAPDRDEDIRGGCPWAVKSAAISSGNHLVACCGIECHDNAVLDFGSLEDMPMEQALEYARNDTLVSAIASLGPAYLLDLLRQKAPEVPLRDRYDSMCEVCEHIVCRPEAVDALRLQEKHLKLAIGLAHAIDGGPHLQTSPRKETTDDHCTGTEQSPTA